MNPFVGYKKEGQCLERSAQKTHRIIEMEAVFQEDDSKSEAATAATIAQALKRNHITSITDDVSMWGRIAMTAASRSVRRGQRARGKTTSTQTLEDHQLLEDRYWTIRRMKHLKQINRYTASGKPRWNRWVTYLHFRLLLYFRTTCEHKLGSGN
jgi:hypothetical protein